MPLSSRIDFPGRRIRWAAAAAIAVLLIAAALTLVVLERPTYSAQPSVDRLALGPAPAPLERVEPPAEFVEPDGPAEAVTAFLQAERDGRLEVSFALLDRRSRRSYPLFQSWVADQAGRPRVRSLSEARLLGPEESSTAAEVSLVVEQEPAVDPFVGFVPARATQRWMARQESGRWRVEDRPLSTSPDLPDDSLALQTAQAWTTRLAACDRRGAESLQAADALYGIAELSSQLCASRSAPQLEPVEEFDPLAGGNSGLAAFGPDVDLWARTVLVRAEQPFRIVMAPLGDQWKVLATLSAGEGVAA